jgi:hypothetical protein
MAEAQMVRNKRDGLIQIRRTASTYTVAVEAGNLTYKAGGYSTWWGLDRGEHMTPRKLDAQRTTLGFSVYLRDLGSAAHATLPDICEEDSRATSWWALNTVSTLTTSDQKASDVLFVEDGGAVGEPDVTLTFDDVVLAGQFAEGDVNTYSVTGEAAIVGPTRS